MGNQSIINKRLHLIAYVNQNVEAKTQRKREEDEGKEGRDNRPLKIFSTSLNFLLCCQNKREEYRSAAPADLPGSR